MGNFRFWNDHRDSCKRQMTVAPFLATSERNAALRIQRFFWDRIQDSLGIDQALGFPAFSRLSSAVMVRGDASYAQTTDSCSTAALLHESCRLPKKKGYRTWMLLNVGGIWDRLKKYYNGINNRVRHSALSCQAWLAAAVIFVIGFSCPEHHALLDKQPSLAIRAPPQFAV